MSPGSHRPPWARRSPPRGPSLVALLGVWLASGCSSAPPRSATLVAGATAIEIGTGDVEYVPLQEGQALRVVLGPQGGFHFLVALLAHGIWTGEPGSDDLTGNPVTTLRAFRPTGEEIELQGEGLNAWSSAYPLDPKGDAALLLNRRLRLDIAAAGDVAGLTMRITATVTDKDGRSAAAERHVIASVK